MTPLIYCRRASSTYLSEACSSTFFRLRASRALLYRKRGQKEEARKLLQTQLYTAVSKAMTILPMLLGGEEEPRRRQKLVDAYQGLARAFGLAGLGEGFLVELHRQAMFLHKPQRSRQIIPIAVHVQLEWSPQLRQRFQKWQNPLLLRHP